jgi:hypothetical protein
MFVLADYRALFQFSPTPSSRIWRGFFSEYCLNLCLARNSGKQVTELMEALLGGRQVDRMVAGALSRLVVVW